MAGYAMGCKPRCERLMHAFPMAVDAIPLVPEEEWESRMEGNTIKDAVWTILDQGSVGACASGATSGAVMAVRAIENLDPILLNMYSLYRQVNDGADNGSGIDENLEALMATGILPESYWPQSKGWKTKPPNDWKQEAAKFRGIEAFDVTSKVEFGSGLCAGHPIVYGVDWDGGGHAICAARAWVDEVEFFNTWNKTWGDNGFGRMPWKQVLAGVKKYGAWALRATTYYEDK